MKIEVTINDCRDCIFARDHRGHGECWKYCSHPEKNRPAYADILWGCGAQFESVPMWCPLNLGGKKA